MKKFFVLGVSLIFISFVNAQDEAAAVKNLPKGDRLMISIYNDLWQDTPDSIDVRTINQGFGIHSMFDFPIKSSSFRRE